MNHSTHAVGRQLSSDDPNCQITTAQYKVVGCWPHSSDAFTEGLDFYNGTLYESTGLCGKSKVRQVELRTGAILREVAVEDVCGGEDCRGSSSCFAEGLTLFQDKLFQLTLSSEKGFIYDATNLSKLGEFSYRGQGWGLTHDDRFLIMSNGTNVIQFLDPKSFKVEDTVPINAGHGPLMLNELQHVGGRIYANLYDRADVMVCIDIRKRVVLDEIDLKALRPPTTLGCSNCSANGIAYNEQTNHLFITGKKWPLLFEIELKNQC